MLKSQDKLKGKKGMIENSQLTGKLFSFELKVIFFFKYKCGYPKQESEWKVVGISPDGSYRNLGLKKTSSQRVYTISP